MTLKIIYSDEILYRTKWLIQLRWFAVLGVFIVISGTKYILRINLPYIYLYLGNIILFIYNVIFFIYSKHYKFDKKKDDPIRKVNRFANLQISMDLIMLTYLIHFSGGVENPFIFYFIFHMVIASILLSNRAAYIQATLSAFLLSLVIAGEYSKILPHYHLSVFLPERICFLTPQYVLGILLVVFSTLYFTVYLTTSIVNVLRKREQELAIANKKLEEQDRLKSQYVLMVSHDLQSSLSTIQSCLKVVLSNLTGDISDKAREMITRAEQRTLNLLQFVRDLLNLSRMRAEKDIEKNIVSLSEILQKVVKHIQSKIKEKKINLTIEDSTRKGLVWANSVAMEHLFINLLENAIKYTPHRGKITVQLSEKLDYIRIIIKDNGIGISKEDIPYIFDDFFRAKNAEQMDKDGTGLGLSIVKQIVKAHNGKIDVESELGKGTKFIITLKKEKA